MIYKEQIKKAIKRFNDLECYGVTITAKPRPSNRREFAWFVECRSFIEPLAIDIDLSVAIQRALSRVRGLQ